MSRFSIVVSATVMLSVSGCASLPNGPSVVVLPGTGISFEQFRRDDAVCQQHATFQVGGTTANQAGMSSGVTSAAIGTGLGAATGAAIGGGSGAAIGAGSGLMVGSIAGTGAASSSMYEVQQRYDVAYIQCMYAKGHQVPVSGQFSSVAPNRGTPAPPPPGVPPPPPQQ